MVTTRTMHSKAAVRLAKAKVLAVYNATRPDPALPKSALTSIPSLMRDGLSGDEFLRALTNGRDGLVRLTLGPNVKTIKCPEFTTLTSEGRPDEPLKLAIIGSYIPMVNLGLRQGVYTANPSSGRWASPSRSPSAGRSPSRSTRRPAPACSWARRTSDRHHPKQCG